jgi:hypothetical protein
MAPAGTPGPAGDGQGVAGSGQHDQLLGPGHGGVEQVALRPAPECKTGIQRVLDFPGPGRERQLRNACHRRYMRC